MTRSKRMRQGLVRNPSSSSHQPGFTLIEALVALSIVAVALMASIKAAGALNTQQAELHARMSAYWSAENIAHELRLRSNFPAAGILEQPCPQGSKAWQCVIDITNTPNPNFRRVEIQVFDPGPRSANQNYNARLVVFLARLP